MGFDNIHEINYEEVSKYFKLVGDKLYRLIQTSSRSYWKRCRLSKPSVGHMTVSFNGKMIKLHRLIFVLHYKRNIKEGFVIDHRNGDKSDNRIENLREVTLRQNNQNKECHREGTPVGATYHVGKMKFQAEIKSKDNKSIYLGDFKNANLAGLAYKIASLYIDRFNGDTKEFRKMVQKKLDEIISNKK